MRVATAPMNWNSDDLPDLRPPIPIQRVLAEMAEAGYAGTEYGTGFPSGADELRALLAPHGLALASMFCWVSLEDRDRQAGEIQKATQVARTLAAMQVRELVLGIRGSRERVALAGRVPPDGSAGLRAAQWETLVDGIERLALNCEPLGVRLAVHPHAGSYVETRDEVERLMRLTDSHILGLCLDTGHLVYAGADPVEVVGTYGSRVWYVHLKDVDPGVLLRCRRQKLSFLEALRAYVFCGLGKGGVDLKGFVDALQRSAFSGWMVLEEDTSPDPPLAAARRNRRYLKETFGI